MGILDEVQTLIEQLVHSDFFHNINSYCLGLKTENVCNKYVTFECSNHSLCFCSDPYCKIKLFQGDREYGEIDSVVTDTIKKVSCS